jgi:signal transduction histidine kinase
MRRPALHFPPALRPLLLAWPVLVSWLMLTKSDPPTFLDAPLDFLFDTTTGIVITIAGLVAWSRRPERRSGVLLVIAGWLWYVGSLYTIVPRDSPIPYFGYAFRGYYDPIIAFVLLTFPRDRLETRFDRIALAALLGAMLVRTGWRLAGPPPLLLARTPETFRDVDIVLSAVVALTMLLIAAALLRRRSRIREGARFVTDPMLLGGAVWALVAVPYGLADLFHYDVGFDIVPWDGPGWTAQYVLRMLGPLGLLVGMLRLRHRSSAVVDLMAVQTGQAGQPRGPELEAALRGALDDANLVLCYPDGEGGWVDATGAATTLPDGDPDRTVTFLGASDAPAAAVIHDPLLLDDPSVVRTMSAVIRLAVDNDRLSDDLRMQLDEVRASRARIVEAADAERRRVERDLHDGAQQRLVALAVSLRTIRVRLGPEANPAVVAELDAAGGEVKAAIEELRELARGLDPAILREAGLGPALQSLADRSPVPVRTDLRVEGRLPARVETTAWFVSAEALANIAKHAQATAATLAACVEDGWLRLSVGDDGIGGADPGGSGLRGLVDRVAATDGTLTVQSAPGGGTLLEVAMPCVS